MRASLSLVLLASTAVLPAQLTLGRPFGDSMVLQRDKPVPLWGTAAPNVALVVSFGGTQYTSRSDARGAWQVVLPALKASKEGRTLELRTPDTILLVENVVVGDVWLCSGQSNMEWQISKTDAHDALAVADKLDQLRFFRLSRTVEFGEKELWKRAAPASYFAGAWQPCSARTAKDFSAVAYWFGRELVERLDVPIGLVMNAVGGSPTEAWLPRAALVEDAAFAPFVKQWPDGVVTNPWVLDMAKKGLAGWKPPEKTTPLDIPPHPFAPGFLWEAGMSWLAPTALRGFVWYQGESNVQDPAQGERLFLALVTQWRRAFGQGELPFVWTQLTSFDSNAGDGGSLWADYRERQRTWLSRVPNSGMAVTLDVGDEKDIHPKNKRDVGRRLALQALAISYGKTEIVSSGPLFAGLVREGAELVASFVHAEGLVAEGGKVLDVEIAGGDGRWVAADAEVRDGKLRARAATVTDPRALRYGFKPFSNGNLRNGARLPASPFRAELPTK